MQGGGFGKPFKLAVIGDVFGQVFTLPLRNKTAQAPAFMGVMWSLFTQGNSEAVGCTDACQTNNWALRGARAIGQSISTALSSGRKFATLDDLTPLVQTLYNNVLATRTALNSPGGAFGNKDGVCTWGHRSVGACPCSASNATHTACCVPLRVRADLEIAGCLGWAGADGGCNRAGPGHDYLVSIVHPTFYNDTRSRYYTINEAGIWDTSSVVHIGNPYDPRGRAREPV